MVITVATILQQLLIVIPSIIASTTIVTGTFNAALNVQNGNVKHLISWVISILCGVITVLSGGLTFGFGWVDYLIGAGFGLVAGGASNGLYDWSVISNIIDNIYFIFGHGDTIKEKRAKKIQ